MNLMHKIFFIFFISTTLLSCSTLQSHLDDISRRRQLDPWRYPENANNTVSTGKNIYQDERDNQLYWRKKIQLTGDIELIGKTYRASKSVNLRAGPNTNTNIVGGLKKGEQFNAMGRIKGVKWIVVSKDNNIVGYVYEPLVHKIESHPNPSLKSSINLDESHDVQYTNSKDLDVIETPNSIDLDVEKEPMGIDLDL